MTGSRPATAVVTGGAGFIGSELVRQLAVAGSHVVVVDNLVNGRRENLAGIDGDVTLLECDVREPAAYAPALRGASVVYHLACLGVRHSLHSPHENHEVNATGTLRLLDASRTAGVPRFVYVSTSEVYGTAKWVPMTEDYPPSPCTVYGASKLAGECYARAYYRTYGYPTVVVRPFNTYGPRSHHEGDSGEVIPKFMLRCLAGLPMVVFGDGTQTRDFTYVADTAEGILRAGESERRGANPSIARACEISAHRRSTSPGRGGSCRSTACGWPATSATWRARSLMVTSRPLPMLIVSPMARSLSPARRMPSAVSAT